MISVADLKFIQHRKLNLILADNIDKLPYSGDKIYSNIMKSLRFCSQHSILESDQNQNVNIFTSSLFCRNKYCFICNHNKSITYTNRFKNLLQDNQENSYFADKYFYFLTLTLKHSKDVRNYIYLKELEQYKAKLFRRVTFKKHFGTVNSKSRNSFISSNEITFNDNGYNIHTHLLIIANPISIKINDLQKQIQIDWKNITSDSWNVRLDLIKSNNDKDFTKTLQEVFKYNVKFRLSSIQDWRTLEKLGDWIFHSHSKKLIKSYGYLRKFNLFSRQNKYDIIKSNKFINYNNEYYLTQSAKSKLSENINISTKIDTKKLDLQNIKILNPLKNSINISNHIDDYIIKIKTREYINHIKHNTLINSDSLNESKEDIDLKNQKLINDYNNLLLNISHSEINSDIF